MTRKNHYTKIAVTRKIWITNLVMIKSLWFRWFGLWFLEPPASRKECPDYQYFCQFYCCVRSGYRMRANVLTYWSLSMLLPLGAYMSIHDTSVPNCGTQKDLKLLLIFLIWGYKTCTALLSLPGPDTVSLGKGFGSKGKQHYKRTASETPTHNQWSDKIKRKLWNIPPSIWD